MRRGRPTKSTGHHGSAKPSPSPLRIISSDPFAALDAPKGGNADELSNRFPTLDQFSILHEKGSKFDFDSSAEPKPKAAADNGLSIRVTMALADEAFARPSPPANKPHLATIPSDSRAEALALEKKRSLETRSEPPRTQAPLVQPVPRKPAGKPAVVSTGTSSSPPPIISNRPIHRFPVSEKRPSSQPRVVEINNQRVDSMPSKRGGHVNRSQFDNLPTSPASSRPSLEGPRPSAMEMAALTRSKSANAKTRPTSAYILRDRDLTKTPPVLPDFEARPHHYHIPHHPHIPHHHHPHHRDSSFSGTEEDAIIDSVPLSSDMDFLRAKEDESTGRKRDKRLSSSGSRHGHVKRSSLPSISLSGTKNILTGRFGDAFRRFENNTSGNQRSRSPSPARGRLTGDRNLTPITGSEATERSDDGHLDLVETEEVSPEIRREIERRRLSQEEKRVADAAAAYRRRLAEKGDGAAGGRGQGGRGPEANAKAMAIQNKVQSLLQRENAPPPRKTAEGYGRFTDADVPVPQARNFEQQQQPSLHPPNTINTNDRFTGGGLRKVVSEGQREHAKPPDFSTSAPPSAVLPSRQSHLPSTAVPPPQQSARLPSRPLAPPKPQKLQSTGTGGPTPSPSSDPAQGAVSPANADDWETNFSKRYPSLNNFEMVETEIGRPNRVNEGKGKDGGVTRVREV
jgi:AP2-associated kinase